MDNSTNNSSSITMPPDLSWLDQLFVYCRFTVYGLSVTMHSIILCVTAKNKNLQGRCNLLIALESLFTLLNHLNGFLLAVMAIVGLLYIPMRICCLLFQPFTVGTGLAAVFMVLFIALDRFLAIVYPFWYRMQTNKKSVYLKIIFGLCILSSWPLLVSIGSLLSDDRNQATICWSTQCRFSTLIVLLGNYWNMGVYVLSAIVYFAFFIAYNAKSRKYSTTTTNNSQDTKEFNATRRLLKALIALCSLYMLGIMAHFTSVYFFTYSNLLGTNEFIIVSNIYSLVKAWMQGITVLVLYSYSSDYRKAINKMFLRMLKILNNRTTNNPPSSNPPHLIANFSNAAAAAVNASRRMNNWIKNN